MMNYDFILNFFENIIIIIYSLINSKIFYKNKSFLVYNIYSLSEVVIDFSLLF